MGDNKNFTIFLDSYIFNLRKNFDEDILPAFNELMEEEFENVLKYALLEYGIGRAEFEQLHESTEGLVTRLILTEYDRTTYLEETDIGLVLLFPIIGLNAILKTPGHLLLSLANTFNYIAKKIKNKTDYAALISKIFKNLPKECKLVFLDKDFKGLNKLIFQKIFGLNSKNINEDDTLFKKAIDSTFLKIFGTYNSEKLANSKTMECYVKYAIEVLKINLELYYKCLYDNKKFLDLINSINKPVDLYSDPDALTIMKLGKLSSQNCSEFFDAFIDTLKILKHVLDNIYKPNDMEKYLKFSDEIKSVIDKVNNEYKKKLEENKEDKNKTDNKGKSRKTSSKK